MSRNCCLEEEFLFSFFEIVLVGKKEDLGITTWVWSRIFTTCGTKIVAHKVCIKKGEIKRGFQASK